MSGSLFSLFRTQERFALFKSGNIENWIYITLFGFAVIKNKREPITLFKKAT